MPEYIDTIVCDAIRLEANNKLTILGFLGNSIYVPQIPTVLASLGVVQRWSLSQAEVGREFMFSLQVILPGGAAPALVLPPQPTSAPASPRPSLNLIAQIQGFPVPQAGDYQFVTYIDGQQRNTYTVFIGLPPAQERPNLIGFPR